MKFIISIYFFFFQFVLYGQTDETMYPWPTPPFNSSKGLNATFGEFRNTGSADHFHNAVDIGEQDGNPVYPSLNGTIHYLSNNGYDSYINVKSIINGKKKHITYYHVVPNPALSIGQQVFASLTQIGTIYVGAAHVHLIERELIDQNSSSLGNEINPVRPEGGLNPYSDNLAPVITNNSLQFYKDNSTIKIPANQLTGKVDISIDVRERNGNFSSQVNNGTYILGYRIFSDDGSNIVYEPENNGMKYRFYFIPGDGYVHSVFVKGLATLSDPIYWLTNGMGEKTINETFAVSNNYLDTDEFAEGNYQLEIFSEDTRSNYSSKRFPISIIKLPPELNTVMMKNDSIYFSWTNYNLKTLKGYRLYYSHLFMNDWKLVADENTLNRESTSFIVSNKAEFQNLTDDNFLKFYLTAIDSNGNESNSSDIYSGVFQNPSFTNYLIVDGFDRYGGNGSWELPNHYFNTIYAKAISNSMIGFNISSCSNEAIINDELDLNNYEMVVWFLGDESLEDNTLVNLEQYKLALYLENGGRLLISGEDLGQDLDTQHKYSEFSDTLFYHQYLKANLMHDGLDILFEVNGQEGTLFEDMNIQFGQTYASDAPDDIEPINGAEPILNYTYMRDDTTYRKGGIAYKGTFGDSTNLGSLVYLSFPFETIGDDNTRTELMKKIQLYLGFNLVDVEQQVGLIPSNIILKQNYPNPFNPTTTIEYVIPVSSSISNVQRDEKSIRSKISPLDRNDNPNVFKNSPRLKTGKVKQSLGIDSDNSFFPASKISVKLTIYDILGREVTTLVNQKQEPGNYQINFNAENYASGIYYYQLKINNNIQTRKMILLK